MLRILWIVLLVALSSGQNANPNPIAGVADEPGGPSYSCQFNGKTLAKCTNIPVAMDSGCETVLKQTDRFDVNVDPANTGPVVVSFRLTDNADCVFGCPPAHGTARPGIAFGSQDAAIWTGSAPGGPQSYALTLNHPETPNKNGVKFSLNFGRLSNANFCNSKDPVIANG